MSIRGNTVGTTMPRANWNQTDPKKADYIQGREDLLGAINDAQTTAANAQQTTNNAKQTADNALSAAGDAQQTADNALSAAGNAQQTANDALSMAGDHSGNKKNPHGVTVEQIGAVNKNGDYMIGNLQFEGHLVKGIGQPVDGSDAVPKSYADTKTSMTLLWENPDLASAFSAQTISLVALSEYDGVEIIFYGDKTTDVYLNTGFLPKDKKGILAYTTSEMGYHLRREFTVTSDGIEFKNGTNTGSVSGNMVCIPYRIYGINGTNGGTGATDPNETKAPFITIESVIESDEDGGRNVVTFSEGTTLTVKNGMKGSKGDNGRSGENGKSAYEYAVEAGYEGTEEDFAKQLANPGTTTTTVTDDGEGNVVISALGAITVTDDGNGNVVLA